MASRGSRSLGWRDDGRRVEASGPDSPGHLRLVVRREASPAFWGLGTWINGGQEEGGHSAERLDRRVCARDEAAP